MKKTLGIILGYKSNNFRTLKSVIYGAIAYLIPSVITLVNSILTLLNSFNNWWCKLFLSRNYTFQDKC